MYRNKYFKLKKGYILVYTLILGMIVMLVALFCFKLVLEEEKNNKSYFKYIQANSKYEDYKELLLTRVNDKINSSVEAKTKENIKNYCDANTLFFASEDSKSNICYDSFSGKLILKSYFDDYYHREDYFDFEVINEKVTYIYKNTKYVYGRTG